MGLLVKYPDKVLKQKCAIVTPEEVMSEDFQFMIDNLTTTMECYDSLGIAANQLGDLKQVFVMKGGWVCINPQVTWRSPENQVMIEGCLSFPQRTIRTRRPKHIQVAFYDRNFKERIENLDGITAAIYLHEYDHLQGKTMLDREYMGRNI